VAAVGGVGVEEATVGAGGEGEDVGASSSMGSAAMASAVLRVESPAASPSYMATAPGSRARAALEPGQPVAPGTARRAPGRPRRRCPVEGRAGEGSPSSEILQIW